MRSGMARTPLSSADTVWLRMEDPANLMMAGFEAELARLVAGPRGRRP
jgi:hypothetical protein